MFPSVYASSLVENSMQSACAIYSESVVRKKRKQKDRDRKKALVPCKCLFCNGNLYSVKKKGAGTSPFLETTCKLTPQVKKVRKVMIKVKRRQGTIIRDEVWILLRALS